MDSEGRLAAHGFVQQWCYESKAWVTVTGAKQKQVEHNALPTLGEHLPKPRQNRNAHSRRQRKNEKLATDASSASSPVPAEELSASSVPVRVSVPEGKSDTSSVPVRDARGKISSFLSRFIRVS